MKRILRIMILPAVAASLMTAGCVRHGLIHADSAIPPLPTSLRADGGYGVSGRQELKRFSGGQSFYFNYRLLFEQELRPSIGASPVLASR